MKTRFEPTNSNDLHYTLTVNMSLKDWKEMRDNLTCHWPNGEFKEQINNMISQASKNFEPELSEIPD